MLPSGSVLPSDSKNVEEVPSSACKEDTISPATTASTISSLSASASGNGASSAMSHDHDAHAVPKAEAETYYLGLHSRPTLVYRTGQEPWTPPTSFDLDRRPKELSEVFGHPIVEVWNNELGYKVVKIMDSHQVRWSVDRFITLAKRDL